MWRFLDHVGYWVAMWWNPQRQLRTGVVLTLASVALLLYAPFTNEQIFIYLMSAAALLLGGLGIIVTAVLAVKEDPDTTEEDLRPKE